MTMRMGSYGNDGDEDLMKVENDNDRVSHGEFEKDIPAPPMEPRLELSLDDEITKHSRLGMTQVQRYKSDREHANRQAELRDVGTNAKENGDNFTHRDCAIRYHYANEMKEAAAAQDNINRYSGWNENIAKDSREALEKSKERIEQFKAAHGELVKNAAMSPTNRDFAPIDQPRGEDPAKKQAWEQRVQLRAVGEAAEARGDKATRVDCALRWHMSEAQASGNMEKLAKVKAEHEIFRERAANMGRSFAHIDAPRGEDQAKKQAWEQRQAEKSRIEVLEFRDAAREPDHPRTEAKATPQPNSAQPGQEQAAPMAKLDAVKARARERVVQEASGQARPVQEPKKADAAPEAGKKPNSDQPKPPATASAQAADTGQVEKAKKDGPVTRSGQARWLKRQGATEPGFIRYATKTPENFKAAKGLYEQRDRGFDKLKAESRNLAAEQQHPTLTEQQHPISPQEERRRSHAR